MRHALFLAPVVLFAAALQAACLPGLLPAGWRPDAGLLLGLSAFVFLPRTAALGLLFALGMQADLFGSARFGLLTFCYMLAAWLVLGFDRDLPRGGIVGAWLAALAGTAVAHFSYALIAAACGYAPGFGAACGAALNLLFAALLFGLPAAWAMQAYAAWMGLLTPEAAEQRAQRARRGGGLLWVK